MKHERDTTFTASSSLCPPVAWLSSDSSSPSPSLSSFLCHCGLVVLDLAADGAALLALNAVVGCSVLAWNVSSSPCT